MMAMTRNNDDYFSKNVAIDDDSGDNSMEMEEYINRADIDLQNAKARCNRMKVPIESSQYTVSPLQNMHQRLVESYEEITPISEEKISYTPRRMTLDKRIKRNTLITCCIFSGIAIVGTVIYVIAK